MGHKQLNKDDAVQSEFENKSQKHSTFFSTLLSIVEFVQSSGDPKPHHHRWWIVITNCAFFCSALFLYLFGNGHSYIFDAIVLCYMGLLSTIFHTSQCINGNMDKLTRKLCAADVISCFVIGTYLIIRYSISIMHLIIGICILPFLRIKGKYYLVFHSIWHVLAAAFFAFLIVFRDQSNFFTYKWWTF